jgi:hypothetical protein
MYSVVISFNFSCVGEIVNSLPSNCYGYSLSIELMVINFFPNIILCSLEMTSWSSIRSPFSN